MILTFSAVVFAVAILACHGMAVAVYRAKREADEARKLAHDTAQSVAMGWPDIRHKVGNVEMYRVKIAGNDYLFSKDEVERAFERAGLYL